MVCMAAIGMSMLILIVLSAGEILHKESKAAISRLGHQRDAARSRQPSTLLCDAEKHNESRDAGR